MPSYPDNKSRVITETNNTIDKLTDEFSVSPTYTCLEMGSHCLAQIVTLYEKQNKKVPKGLLKFLKDTYPTLVEEQKDFIAEQHLMLNTSGSA